jgi:hypothetical protein
MTVRELIEALQAQDPEAIVVVRTNYGEDWDSVEGLVPATTLDFRQKDRANPFRFHYVEVPAVRLYS